MALSTACKEAIAMRRLMIELGCGDVETPTVAYGDNLSAQQLAKNPVHHAWTKYVDIRYHFARETVDQGQIVVKYASTEIMIADILTKNLHKKKHEGFVKFLDMNKQL